MAETLIKGIITDIKDHDVYDQIIDILLPSNLKRSFLCKGTKKILSKNSRHISLLNEIEIECFLSNDIKKLSKLKKITYSKLFSWEYLDNMPVKILLKYLSMSSSFKENFYNFLVYLKTQLLQYKKTNILKTEVYRIIFRDIGLNFYFQNCINCHSTHIYTISIENSGLVCRNCNFYKEKIYPIWFIKNFYKFMNNNNKINFINEDQENFFYDEINKILKMIINKNSGF